MALIALKDGDVCTSSERIRFGWEERPSLTKEAAMRLLGEASAKMDPDAPAKINPGITNAQAFAILGGGTVRNPVGFLISKNILKQCGVPLKQMKEIKRVEVRKGS